MAEYNSLRKSGNTTRQIDEWVQLLFKHGQVRILDHHFSMNRDRGAGHAGQEMAEQKFFQRLYMEHHLSLNKEYKFNSITKLVYFT